MVGQQIDGTNRRDNLTGTEGDDEINGFGGRDKLDGGAGNDMLDGGRGRDHLIGGEGDDHLTGGRGRDFFDFRDLAGDDTIKDLSWFDRVIVSKDNFANFQALEDATEFADGDAVITAGDAGSITLKGIDEHELNAHQFIFV